jgi:TonB family protein
MRVLLVDHDSEALEAITRAIRGVLELDCVTSKGDALLLLRQNTYDVLIACERCVDGSGLDLLGRTTRTTVPLKRIFASAPERLQLLGPRLAPFKVQRTINYPIDLEELWLAIAQVTGTNDETDGTIERVVLDERGIPASGSTPRAPIPSRPPAPQRDARVPSPMPVAAISAVASGGAGGGRAAAARMTQPVPDPPLRPPPPPRQPPPVRAQAPPATTSDTGRMRAPAPPGTTSDTGRMRAPQLPAPAPAQPREEMTSWAVPSEDDFAAVAAQARLGVQRKVVDEASRRKKQRLLTASIAAVAVAGVIVMLIEKFYDPDARARQRAIAAEVSRMAEQQKVTDDLTLIEVDIEKAIMDNDLELARLELARLVERSPDHPRREFLQKSIDRAAELARLASQTAPARDAAAGATPERPASRSGNTPRPAERVARAERNAALPPTRDTEQTRGTRVTEGSGRVFGAPIGEAPPRSSIPLDAPINSAPTTAPARSASSNSFGGRTVEASDSPQDAAASTAAITPGPSSSGTTVSIPSAAPPAAAPAPTPVEVVPAKLVKRVAPVVSYDVPRKAEGHVVVSIEITEAGRVGNVTVLESTPAGVFDEAALTAVRKWLYEPRRENGAAVASTARARLVFEAAN